MPSMANITVKAANGTTDVVYTALAPSGGDSTPAYWRAEGAGASASVRPVFSLMSKSNGPKTARRVTGNGTYPHVATVDGVETVVNRIPFEFSFLVPLAVPDTVVAEAVHQMSNLVAATLVRDSVKSGFAPN